MMGKFRNKIITSIDIGSSKIVCLIAEIQLDNNIKIIGVGHNASQGFNGTVITDIKLAESSIISAVYEAETMAKTNINNVLILINGNSVSNETLEKEININEQVTQKEIKELLSKTIHSFPAQNREIIHFFPLDYGLDDNFGIKDPLGMYGYNLKLRSKIFHLPSTHIINLVNCLEKCRLHVSSIVISGYATSLACLTEEEKDQGVCLLDLGANTSSIIVFYKNVITEFVTLSIGGAHITSDISYGLTIDFAAAERVKIVHGNAFLTSFDEGKMIDLFPEKGSDDNKSYASKAELSLIIRARLEEIFELIKNQMSQLNMQGLSSKKIILAGGTSKLIGIKEIASTIFGHNVKIALPKSLPGIEKFADRADFSTSIGGIIFALENSQKKEVSNKNFFKFSYDNIFSKFFRWLKENL